MMMSMAKSSMAGYKISSTDRFRRWISSTKRMSFSLRLVSSAARSPGFSMAGPEVTRRLTPISLAMMPESVVLPRPGGPWSSTWSRGSPRSLAASMKIERFSLAFSWPMYSVSVSGTQRQLPLVLPQVGGGQQGLLGLLLRKVDAHGPSPFLLRDHFSIFFRAWRTMSSRDRAARSKPFRAMLISAGP